MRGPDSPVPPPALDGCSDLPLFNTKAVALQTGVPAPTLRAWERRYGILTPHRGRNDYRLYSERDIVMVNWLRQRVQTGMTISQAIALFKSLESAQRRPRRTTPAVQPESGAAGRGIPPAVGVVAQPAIGLYSVSELRTALLDQFANLDEYAARRTIAQALAIYPVEDACEQVLTPVMVDLGELWASGEISVTVEHFSANLVRAQLDSIFRSVGETGAGPLTLVGCASGELHELGALMLALFLRRAGLRVAYLGQSVEVESLVHTVTAVHPGAVLLSATMPEHIGTLANAGERLANLQRPRPLFGFGGQAFAADPGLARAIPGMFLGSDARKAVHDMRKRLSA